MTEKRAGRYLVQRFAAHLAHLLNTGDEFIEIKNFALYRTLIRTLAGPPDATGCRYAARHSASPISLGASRRTIMRWSTLMRGPCRGVLVPCVA